MKRSECPQYFLNYRLVGWLPVITIFLAIIGWPLCLALALWKPVDFGPAYFTVLSFFGILAMGALFWILLHHAVDAAWSVIIRRIWEHEACLLLPLFILSIPLFFLYSKICSPIFASGWLLPLLPCILLVGSLLVLIISAQSLRRASLRDDDNGSEAKVYRRLTFMSLPVFAIGFSLISILAWMSLQGGWVSAIWPIYIFSGAALSSLALTILIVIWLLPSFNGNIKADHFHLFGKLLFALTLFWGYLAFGQYLIIWYGNLPTENSFFQIRSYGLASYAGWVLVVGHFLIPFLFLLPRSTKMRPKWLALVAGWLVLMQFVEFCWIILPPLHGNWFFTALSLLVSLSAVGGTLTFIFLMRLGRYPLWPILDHRLQECLSLIDQ
ncbi:MAG: hypothetical protein C5B47_04110 [Verrucomicrobia bacterium]|nr:MAG: hypothetical protein C5B47_04110 [Verrucomicrobiota bacterium]